jgi:23S rRNA (uracil1939-C5)-methyltransferase
MNEVELLIENFNGSGDGVALYPKDAPFPSKVAVSHAIVGDLIKADLYKRKKRGFLKARLSSIVKKSELRGDPHCSHCHICGGCRWQEMEYSHQLKFKEKIIAKEFLGLLQNVKVFPIIPSDDPYHYRNKMEFSFSENGAKTKFLGLMIAAANRYVFNVEKCHLASFWFSDVLNAVRSFWEKSSIKAYNHNCDEGSLRTLTIREGKNTNEKMVFLTVSGNSLFALSKSEINGFVDVVKEIVPQASIFLRIWQIAKKEPTQFFDMHLFGKDHIKEKMTIFGKELFFKISPSSFFQPNTFQAQKLYSKALELSNVSNGDTVFDLYCGTGTLGMVFASHVKKVYGIELNADAVIDAEENLKLNGIQNFHLHKGDVGKVLTALIAQKINPDLIIVDPPRAGLDALALENIKSLRPKKFLYVSCNPKTQSENIKDLIQAGYILKVIQPVDQFPHTIHIENIALLELE